MAATPGKRGRPAKSTDSTEVRRQKKKFETFSVYLYRVLKQSHPEFGMSKKSMSIMNSFVHDIFEKIATEGARMVRYNKKHTLSSREILAAVKLLFPGDLAKHAFKEGTDAVTKYQAFTD